MRRTGLFKSDEIRVANEGKIRARWKFGKLLAKVERAQGAKRSLIPILRVPGPSADKSPGSGTTTNPEDRDDGIARLCLRVN
jgi:hypothetical protein